MIFLNKYWLLIKRSQSPLPQTLTIQTLFLTRVPTQLALHFPTVATRFFFTKYILSLQLKHIPCYLLAHLSQEGSQPIH